MLGGEGHMGGEGQVFTLAIGLGDDVAAGSGGPEFRLSRVVRGSMLRMPLIKNRVKGRSPGDQIAVVVRQNLARGASHYRHGGNRLG